MTDAAQKMDRAIKNFLTTDEMRKNFQNIDTLKTKKWFEKDINLSDREKYGQGKAGSRSDLQGSRKLQKLEKK